MADGLDEFDSAYEAQQMDDARRLRDEMRGLADTLAVIEHDLHHADADYEAWLVAGARAALMAAFVHLGMVLEAAEERVCT